MKNIKIDFIGIGAARCGTTWISEVLREHPEICFPYMKELNYFSRTRARSTKSEYEIRGIKNYLSLYKNCKDKKIKGEFSTYYLHDPKVAEVIKKHFPNIKIIVILREPVERAYSDYLNVKILHLKEKDSFETAFLKKTHKYLGPYDNYMWRGMYYKQLKLYFDLFPKENIKVILFDDIRNNPKKVTKELYKFLNIDPNFIPNIFNKKSNPVVSIKFKSLRRLINNLSRLYRYLESKGFSKILSSIKRKAKLNKFIEKINNLNVKSTVIEENLDQELKDKLKKVYLKDIKKLEKLIERDLSSWR